MKKEEKEGISFSDRLWSSLAYFWVFAFIPFILKRKEEFIFFHAKQGVVLFITEIILILILPIPFLGWFIAPLGLFLCAFFSFRGIFSALRGEKWIIPYLGRYANEIKF